MRKYTVIAFLLVFIIGCQGAPAENNNDAKKITYDKKEIKTNEKKEVLKSEDYFMKNEKERKAELAKWENVQEREDKANYYKCILEDQKAFEAQMTKVDDDTKDFLIDLYVRYKEGVERESANLSTTVVVDKELNGQGTNKYYASKSWITYKKERFNDKNIVKNRKPNEAVITVKMVQDLEDSKKKNAAYYFNGTPCQSFSESAKMLKSFYEDYLKEGSLNRVVVVIDIYSSEVPLSKVENIIVYAHRIGISESSIYRRTEKQFQY